MRLGIIVKNFCGAVCMLSAVPVQILLITLLSSKGDSYWWLIYNIYAALIATAVAIAIVCAGAYLFRKS